MGRAGASETGMQRPTALPVVLALLALLVPVPRAIAVVCRQVCKPAVQRCVDAGNRRRRCKRMLIQQCKQTGQVACDEAFLPPTRTSTTTTEPPTTTTRYVTTTTRYVTTSTFRATTTTTLRQSFSVTGTWYLSVNLVLNDCGLSVDSYVSSTLRLRQSGTSITGTMGSLPVSGSIDYVNQEWEVVSQPSCGTSCCVASGVKVDPLTNRASAVLAVVGRCTSGLTCTVGYSGSISRY